MCCHGWNCNATKLIDAHIMPRGFARDLLGTNKQNVLVNEDGVRATQHGAYDPKILCADCDGKLGVFDHYAVEMSRRFKADHVRLGNGFSLPNVDGDKLAKFALALLWRASISTRPEVSHVHLGPYEAQAQEVLFGQRDLRDMLGYQLMVSRYDHPRVEEMLSYPAIATGLSVNAWGFVLNGFRFLAKLDKRRWPDVPAELLAASVVQGHRDLIGQFVPFVGTPEHANVEGHAAADRESKLRRQRRLERFHLTPVHIRRDRSSLRIPAA